MVDIAYRLGDPLRPGLFLIGSIGAIKHQYKSETFPDEEASETGLAFGAGAGVDMPLKTMKLFAIARYLTRDGTNFIPIQIGIAFPIGGRSE